MAREAAIALTALVALGGALTVWSWPGAGQKPENRLAVGRAAETAALDRTAVAAADQRGPGRASEQCPAAMCADAFHSAPPALDPARPVGAASVQPVPPELQHYMTVTILADPLAAASAPHPVGIRPEPSAADASAATAAATAYLAAQPAVVDSRRATAAAAVRLPRRSDPRRAGGVWINSAPQQTAYPAIPDNSG